MMDTTNIAGPDRLVALDYVFSSTSLIDVCERNARAAKEKGRFDHERIFRTLQPLFRTPEKREDGQPAQADDSFSSDLLAIGLIMQLRVIFAPQAIHRLTGTQIFGPGQEQGHPDARHALRHRPPNSPRFQQVSSCSHPRTSRCPSARDTTRYLPSPSNQDDWVQRLFQPSTLYQQHAEPNVAWLVCRWHNSVTTWRTRSCPFGCFVEQFERKLG